MVRVLTTPQLPLGRRITVDDQGSNSEIDCLVDTDGSGVPSPTVSHLVYCSPLFGSDTEGNGSEAAPFATIAHAYSTITDAAADNIYDVVLFPGTYSENVGLKPFIRVIGYDPSQIADGTYPANINGNVTLAAAFSTSGSVAWLTAVDVSGTVSLDFVTATSTNGIVSITDSQLEDDVLVTMAGGNTFDLHGCVMWANYTQTGGIGFWFNTAGGADIGLLALNAIAGTGATLNMTNSHFRGDVEIDQSGVTDAGITLNMWNSFAREGTVTVTAAGAQCPNINAPFGALPENVVLAGSSAAALSRQMRVSKALAIPDTELQVGITDFNIPLPDSVLGATSIESLHCKFTPRGTLWTSVANAQVMWSFYVKKNGSTNEVHLCLLNTDVITQSGALPFLFEAYFPNTTT